MSLNVGTAVGYLDLDTKKFESGIKGAMKQLEVFNNNTSTSGQKMEALGGVMKNVGAGMTKFVTAPLVGVGALSIKTAADFESGMSKVQAISGATGEDMKKLENMAKDLGASTKFSARDAADALSYMGMAGWKTEDMMSGLPGVLDLAAAGGTDLALTSDIVTDGLTGLGLTAKDTGMFVDVMAATCSNSNTSIELMGESLKYVGPVAGALGIDMQDLSLSIGLMGNAGIKGSQAGTALRAGLTNLVKPTKQMQATMDKYNIEIQKNADGSVDLMGTMNHLRERLGGLNETTQANALATIFGKEAMSGWAAIVNASESDFEKLSGAISNSEGAAKTMAETMQDNLKGAIDNFKSALEGAAIVIGERLIPMFQGIVEWATNTLTWFNNLDGGTQDLIVAVGLLAAAIGPLLLVAGTLLTVLPNMVTGFKLAKTAMKALNVAVLGVPLAVGLLIAALVGLATGIGGSINAIVFLQDKFGVLGEVIGGTCEIINGIVQLTFGNMIIIIQTAAKAIQAIFKGQFWKLDDIAKEGWAKVENNTAEAMSDIAAETTEGVRLIKTKSETELQEVIETFDLAMKELPKLTKDNAGQIAQTFTNSMADLDTESLTILRGTSDTMAVLFEGIREGMNPEAATKKFTANLESMAISGKYDMETLQGDIDKAMKTINSNMLIEGEAFKQNATNVFNEFKTVGTQGVEGMASNVANILFQMDTETVSQLSTMGGTWSQILSGVAADGSMNTTQMKDAIISNFSSMGIDGAQLISQLRTESSTHMKGMADDAKKNSKDLETSVDQGTKGAKDKGVKNLKEFEKQADDTTKGTTDKVSKNTKQLAKNTEDDMKKAGNSAKTQMDKGAKGVKDATSKMSSDTKRDTSKIANDIDEDFKKGTKSVQQEATNMYNGAKKSFTKLAEIAKQAGSDAYNGIRVSFSKIPDIVKDNISAAADNAGSKTSAFKSAGKAAGQAWIDGFNSKKSAMSSAVASVPKPKMRFMSFAAIPETPVRVRRSLSFAAMPSIALTSFNSRSSSIASSVASSLTSAASSLGIVASFRQAGEDSANAYIEGLAKISEAVNTMLNKNEKSWKSGTDKITTLNKEHTKELLKLEQNKNNKIKDLEAKKEKAIKEANSKYAKDRKKRQAAINKADETFREEQLKAIKKFQQDEVNLKEKQNKELAKLKEDNTKAEKSFYDNLEKIKEDYTKKVTDLSKKQLDEEAKLNEEYQKIYDSRVKTLMGWTDIFAEVKEKEDISGQQLITNLQGQIDVFESWNENMDTLATVIGKDLYEELLSKGPQAYKEIEALNNLTMSELEKYEDLFLQKKKLAEKRAAEDTKEEKERIEKQITAVREKYQIEYEKLGKQMAEDVEKQVNMVKDKFGTIPEKLLQTGKSSINQFIVGLESMKGKLQSTVSSIVNSVNSSLSTGLSKSVSRSVSGLYDIRRKANNIEMMAYSDKVATQNLKTAFKNTVDDFKSSLSSEKKDPGENRAIVFNNTYNSPKPVSIKDLKKQDEIQMRRLSLKFR